MSKRIQRMQTKYMKWCYRSHRTSAVLERSNGTLGFDWLSRDITALFGRCEFLSHQAERVLHNCSWSRTLCKSEFHVKFKAPIIWTNLIRRNFSSGSETWSPANGGKINARWLFHQIECSFWICVTKGRDLAQRGNGKQLTLLKT